MNNLNILIQIIGLAELTKLDFVWKKKPKHLNMMSIEQPHEIVTKYNDNNNTQTQSDITWWG